MIQSHPRHLAADRVEATENDGLRRVVDDEVDAGRMLEGPNVAALSTDDAALHLVAGDAPTDTEVSAVFSAATRGLAATSIWRAHLSLSPLAISSAPTI